MFYAVHRISVFGYRKRLVHLGGFSARRIA
jgi:hypothetical protein